MIHSTLSPSSSERWLACPGGLLESLYTPVSDSKYAAEGTLAHEWFERMLNGDTCKTLLFDNTEMYIAVQSAYDYIASKCPLSGVNTETRVDIFSLTDAERTSCFGTVDAWGFDTAGVLHVFDFKYGRGVRVNARDNSQLKLYAYGICVHRKTQKRNISAIVVHIVQPRINNYSMAEYTALELEGWVKGFVIPTATLALSGYGQVNKGAWCTFCPCKGTCYATAFCDVIDSVSRPYEKLTLNERLEVVDKRKDIENWLEAVEARLLADVLDGTVKDYRVCVVEKRGRTKITDEARAINLLKEAGATDYMRTSLLPYGQLKAYHDLLKDVVECPTTTRLEITQ